MESTHQTLVRSHFDEEATFWREVYESSTIESALYLTRHEKMLSLAEGLHLRPGARILEVGCGAGVSSAALARRGYEVVAVDLVERMLESARLTGEQDNVHDRLIFACSDVEHLPFEQNTFDAAIGLAVLEWVPSPEKALAELARVLRPGGHAILSVANRWSLNRMLDPQLSPCIEPAKHFMTVRGMRGAPALRARTVSRRELMRGLRAAGLVQSKLITTGFGPFTFLKLKLLPGARGMKLHRTLEKVSDRGAFGLRRTGHALLVTALKLAANEHE